MTTWVEKIYSLVEQGKSYKAINILFKEIDDLLCEGEFETCNESLKTFDLERLDTSLLVGLLSITFPASDKLSYRPEMVEKIRTRLENLAPDRVGRLRSM